MDKIVGILRKAANCYYNDDYYEMSEEEQGLIKEVLGFTCQLTFTDDVYDAVYFKLKELIPNHPFFLSVGSEVRGDKVKLPTELGSMVECKFGEINSWLVPNSYVVVSSKLDGNSALLVYDNGVLKAAYSRGNGYEGQDITRHLKKLSTVPLYMSNGFTGFIRGEVIIEKDKIQNFITDLEKETGKKYANGRNGVAGQLNSKECSLSFSSYAMFIAYKIVNYKDSEHHMFQDLTDMGFRTPKFEWLPTNCLIDDTESKLIDLCTKAKTEDMFECDGIIITQDEVLTGFEGFETSSLNPKCSRKYKVANVNNSMETEVEYIEWNVSKDGYFKPRVKVKPINLQGVVIDWATGHNYKNVTDKKICVGAKIKLKRSGDVIPYIEEVLDYPDIQDYTLPEDYLFNGVLSENGEVVDIELADEIPESYIDENNISHFCIDEYDVYYSQMMLQKLVYFCQKMSIDYAGEGNLKKLMEITDNKHMDVHNLLILSKQVFEESIGVNGIKFYESLHNAMKKATQCQFFDATGCFGRGIGELKLQKIYDKYNELPYDENKILAVDGWSNKMTEQYMSKYICATDWVDWLYKNYNNFSFPIETKEVLSQKYSETKVVFTGVRDKVLEEVITSNGGKVLSSFTKECNLVVAKDPNSGSSKLVKAKERGIEVISIDEARNFFS